jgi:type II secretory pathway pseudopilin PulG
MRGFTILELTIAITITAITALSVAAATVALSKAHEDTEGFYQSLYTARSAMVRIQRIIYRAKLVTASNGTTVMLWADDVNDDGKINAEEILMLAYDATAREVSTSQQVFPAGLRDALNVEVPLATLTSLSTAVPLVDGSGYKQTTVLASDVSAFLAIALPSPPLSKLVNLRLSVGSGKNLVTLRSAATARGGRTSKVVQVGGHFTLVN